MEKKKIMARKAASAEEQEIALSILLGKTAATSFIEEEVSLIKEVAVKSKTTKATPKKEVEKVKRPATTVRRKAQDIMKPLVEVQRITIDLPADLYDLLKQETEIKGTTLKWQIVSLLKEHFKKA
jgi:hypothetical protein